MKKYMFLSLLVALMTVVVPAQAADITVGNAGFEDFPIDLGSWTDAPEALAPWVRATAGSSTNATIQHRPENFEVGAMLDLNGMQYVVISGTELRQELAQTWAADTTYTLEFDVGHSGIWPEPTLTDWVVRLEYDGVEGELQSGEVVTQASAQIDGIPSYERWQHVTMTHTTGATGDELGENIEIVLGPGTTIVCLDNIAMTSGTPSGVTYTLTVESTGVADPCTMPEVDASAYRLVDGKLEIPSLPGFGLQLDHAAIDRRVAEEGWVVSA